MAHKLFLRQLKVGLVPVIVFLACFVGSVIHRDTLEGSAGQGEIRNGKYFLSVGHGHYQETWKERFEMIRKRERIQLFCNMGMLGSAVTALMLVTRAGLPLKMKPMFRKPDLLRPRR